MWIGPTPLCLQDLTIPEQILISPRYTCMNIIQLTNKRHTHHKLKGHIVTLPQNLGSIVKVLPLPTYRLCEYIKVMFVGQGNPTDYHLKKVLQVRKSKITTALCWLFKHNILFKNFKFDKTILDTFPEGEIPDSLLLTTTHVNINSQEYEHYTGYVQDPFDCNESDSDNDDNSTSRTAELRSSGILNTDNVPVTENELILLAIQKLLNKSNKSNNSQLFDNTIINNNNNKNKSNNSNPPLVYIPHSCEPLNEYRDDFLFPAAFPTLFSYGVGGHEGRIPHVSLK